MFGLPGRAIIMIFLLVNNVVTTASGERRRGGTEANVVQSDGNWTTCDDDIPWPAPL